MQGKKIKIIIVVLAVLLAVSSTTLIGTLVVRHFNLQKSTSVEVPGNIITPDAEDTGNKENQPDDTNAPGETDTPEPSVSAAPSDDTSSAAESTGDLSANAAKASPIALHNRKPENNIPFQTTNLFPGDRETKYFCVKVSYKGDIIIRYHADIRSGYEKLAEVLKVRIRLLDEDRMLYDGLMRDMPESLNHALHTSVSTKSELYYEITAYLDTSVGNEYQDKELIADFSWWVEETDHLDSAQTGDTLKIYLLIALASGSLILLLILVGKRRKETADE